MAHRLIRVGLTGGIATGKSVCLASFAALGVPTVDADRIARDLVAPGTDGLAEVIARFGPRVIGGDGALDRAALGRIVFADAEARRDLEAIIHPGVFARLQDWFASEAAHAADSGSAARAGLAVADVPLLFEAGSEDYFDVVVVAACRPDQQLARVMSRDGLSEADARLRISAQWPLDQKRARADYVIDTSGTVTETERQVKDVVERLRQ